MVTLKDVPFKGVFDMLGDANFDKSTSGKGDFGGLHLT